MNCYATPSLMVSWESRVRDNLFTRRPAWYCTGHSLRTTNPRHNTQILCYTLQLLRYVTAGYKLQTSHTSSVFHLEEVPEPMDTICVCKSVFRHVFSPASEKCVLVFPFTWMSECASANSHACASNKRAHWFTWKKKAKDSKRSGPGSYHSVV